MVPSFFVGATFGCVAGPLLGIPAGFAAALGLAAVFCGATNCPLASIFLSVELFGDGGLLYFALVCGISYMLSGYNGLYSSQTIVYSKLKAQYINVRTNAYHAGEPVPPSSREAGKRRRGVEHVHFGKRDGRSPGRPSLSKMCSHRRSRMNGSAQA